MTAALVLVRARRFTRVACILLVVSGVLELLPTVALFASSGKFKPSQLAWAVLVPLRLVLVITAAWFADLERRWARIALMLLAGVQALSALVSLGSSSNSGIEMSVAWLLIMITPKVFLLAANALSAYLLGTALLSLRDAESIARGIVVTEPDPFADPFARGRQMTVGCALVAGFVLFGVEIINSRTVLFWDPVSLGSLRRWALWTTALVLLHRAHPTGRWLLGFLLLGTGVFTVGSMVYFEKDLARGGVTWLAVVLCVVELAAGAMLLASRDVRAFLEERRKVRTAVPEPES